MFHSFGELGLSNAGNSDIEDVVGVALRFWPKSDMALDIFPNLSPLFEPIPKKQEFKFL